MSVSDICNKTGIRRKDIDNLVQWGHVVPTKQGNRRLFDEQALCQMCLYGMAKGVIPPTVTCEIGSLIPIFLDENYDAAMIAVWSEGGKWKIGATVPPELIGLEFKTTPFRVLMGMPTG